MMGIKGFAQLGLRAALIFATTAVITGCVSTKAQRRPYLVRENLDNAARHLQNENKEEAQALYQVVLVADPTNTEAKAGLAKAGNDGIDLLTPNLLGVNKSRRPRTDSIGMRIALYPVNRVLDVCDCFSFHVGLESGVLVDAHVTRAVQLLAGGGGGMELGWREPRDLYAGFGTDVGVGLGPFSAEADSTSSVGTDGAKARTFSVSGVAHPTDHAYQNYRDYWGVGANAIVGIVGVGAEFHPVELVDAVAGFFFIDFLNDDLGTTRGMKFNDADLDAAEDLLNSLSAAELRAHLSGCKTAP